MSDFYPYNYKGYPQGLDYPWFYPMPSEKERDRRWSALRAAMKAAGLDCLILGGVSGYVFFPNNYIAYLSNYVPVFNPGTFIVFPVDGGPLLALNSSIGPQFQHFAGAISWIREISGSLDPARDIEVKVKNLRLEKGRLGLIGYNNGTFPASVNDFLRRSLPSARVDDVTGLLVNVMNTLSRTSEEEQAFLSKACEIHDISFQKVSGALKPGVTEKELLAISEQAIISNGGWSPHFMLVTSGPRPTFVRGPASHNVIKLGDIVMFETNIIYGGVLSQTAFTLALGQPAPELIPMFDYCSELYQVAIDELEKGRNFGDVEKTLVDRIHKLGFEPMTPQMHIYNASGSMPADSPPQPGDYFTIHPNFSNKEFTLGAKFGDCVRVNRKGKIERMHKTPAKLNIVEV